MLWDWILALRLQIIEKETKTGYYKMKSSPDFVVSDLHITTRRIKEVPNTDYPQIKQWITPNFNPFADEFDSDIYDSEPF